MAPTTANMSDRRLMEHSSLQFSIEYLLFSIVGSGPRERERGMLGKRKEEGRIRQQMITSMMVGCMMDDGWRWRWHF